MNDAKPWSVEEVDGSSAWFVSNEDWRARTLATCRQRDELVAALGRFIGPHSSLCFAPTIDGGTFGCTCDERVANARAVLAKWGAP